MLQLPKVLGDFKGTADHEKAAAGLKGVADEAKGKKRINKGESWTYNGRTERSKTELAYETWVKGLVKLGAINNIRDKIKNLENAQKTSVMLRKPSNARVYYLVPKGEKLANPTVLMTGTLDELLDDKLLTDRSSASHRMLVPLWHKDTKQKPGDLQYYDADHIMEEQLGGDDSVENMWLWESKSNQSSGSRIYNAINNQAKALIDAATGPTSGSKWGSIRPTQARRFETSGLLSSSRSAVLTRNFPTCIGCARTFAKASTWTDCASWTTTSSPTKDS